MVRHQLYLDRAALNAEGMNVARKSVRKVVRRTLNRSAILTPVDTGYLRASGQSSVADRGLVVVGEVKYTANYAAAVHEGRRALTIRAKGGGRLRFVVDGRVVYARQVHQPARAGRPFLSTALREVAAQEGFRVSIGHDVRRL
jgi:hypothetical protein